MKRAVISIRVKKINLIEKVEIAEEAIKKLNAVMNEIEFIENGLSERISAEEIEGGSKEAENEHAHIYLIKSIDEEAIKVQLATVQEIMKPLKEAVKGLGNAIITELTKEKPQA